MRYFTLAKILVCSVVGQIAVLWRNRGYKIICPADAIGDIVFTAEIVRELKRKYPEEKFCMLINGKRKGNCCAARMLSGIFDRIDTRCPPLPKSIVFGAINKAWPAFWKAGCSDFGYPNCLYLFAKATDLRLTINKAQPLRLELKHDENWNRRWPSGKTVLICPDANSTRMPNADEIWSFVAESLRRKGFAVVFNAKDDTHCKGFDTVFYDVEMTAAFADYCGYVVALRCGLADLLAYVTTARILAVYSHNLDDWYWTVSDAWRNAGYEEADDAFLRYYSLSGMFDREGLYDCFFDGMQDLLKQVDRLISIKERNDD